jgi:hypothetical protein
VGFRVSLDVMETEKSLAATANLTLTPRSSRPKPTRYTGSACRKNKTVINVVTSWEKNAMKTDIGKISK